MISSLLSFLVLASLSGEIDQALTELSQEVRTGLVATGAQFESSALEAYAQARLHRLFDHQASFELVFVDQSEANAFTLPDGSIFLDVRLLLLLERAADLDFVLAHEAAHKILGHAIKPYAARRWKKDDAIALELEADKHAYRRLQANDVDTQAIAALLHRLHRDEEHWGETHPGLAARLQLAPNHSGVADVALEGAFNRAVQNGRVRALTSLLGQGDWRTADVYLARHRDNLPERAGDWLLAESDRLSDVPRRRARAVATYRRLVHADPNLAQAWYGLAMALDAAGRCGDASPIWHRLIEIGPPAHRVLIEHRSNTVCAEN